MLAKLSIEVRTAVPVHFIDAPAVARRLAPVLPLLADKDGVPLKEAIVSDVVTRFAGTPMVVCCYGG